MRKQDFQFELPESLIANYPCEQRTHSRLLVLDPQTQTWQDSQFMQLLDHLQPNDCLIFNNTKVIPARLLGQRDTGGKVEILLERFASSPHEEQNGKQQTCLAQLKASNQLPEGSQIIVAEDFILQVVGRENNFYRLANLSEKLLMDLFEEYGSMPLPPYIQRSAEPLDSQRYQTVYANQPGAVAAPTAGLHFDESLMQAIKNKGIAYDFVTLHVAAGTFSPVRVEQIEQHKMHSETFQVSPSVVDLVQQTRKKGGRVIAVGTTAVRSLESSALNGELSVSHGETDIFIYPGYQFKVVDAMITNFHLSESTLLMLVSAFAGREFILQAYRHAVDSQYRFFSYGDAMFIQNKAKRSS